MLFSVKSKRKGGGGGGGGGQGGRRRQAKIWQRHIGGGGGGGMAVRSCRDHQQHNHSPPIQGDLAILFAALFQERPLVAACWRARCFTFAIEEGALTIQSSSCSSSPLDLLKIDWPKEEA